jgi:hypothetical protein
MESEHETPSPEQPVGREEDLDEDQFSQRPDETPPPSSPEADEDSVREGEDKLDQAG